MCVPDADLHGQHLWGRVVLQEMGQVTHRGHQEARPVSAETQPQEAVALSQRGVSGGAGPALQESTHLWAAEAPGRGRAGLWGCDRRRERQELVLVERIQGQPQFACDLTVKLEKEDRERIKEKVG